MRKTNLFLPIAFRLEERMIHLLMFRGDFLKDNGLFAGKMGLVLFFAYYHKITSGRVYESVADELMEQILETIHKELPIGLGKGLCGIGWGIENLIQNGLMEGDSIEICEEIDRKLMEKDPRRITDLSLENGMEGILHYVLAHIAGVSEGHSIMPFDETYLADLYSALERLRERGNISNRLAELIYDYTCFYTKKEKISYKSVIDPFVELMDINEKKLISCSLGLRNGIAGILFKSLIIS